MAITDLDEQGLVRAHQAGDEQAFGQIVRSQHRALYAHALRRLGSHESAEDAVQDTLLRAYRALPSLDGDLRLRAWLHRILTNVCHDEGNRRRRQAGLIDQIQAQPIEVTEDPADELVLHDTVRVMADALQELPETYREALVLRYVDGLSFREVAEVTGVTEENARARAHRGRVALHKVMSRLAIMVAFVVPGVRRAGKGLTGADAATAASTAEPTVSLSTQLASHVYQAAPVLNRVAADGGNLVAAKSSVVATAAVAVAAVAAPVAAYRVYETATPPERPPAAVAAPAAEHESVAGSPTTIAGAGAPPADGPRLVLGLDGSTATSTSSSTSSTLPPSAARPFAGSLADDEPTTTTTTTSTTEPATETTVAPPLVETVGAVIEGAGFDVTGTRPDHEVTGPVALSTDESTATGTLGGSVYVADDEGGPAKAELVLDLDDGRRLRVRFTGRLRTEEATGGSVVWTLTGRYAVPGGADVGVAEAGEGTITFRLVDGGASSLRLDLRGERPSGDS